MNPNEVISIKAIKSNIRATYRDYTGCNELRKSSKQNGGKKNNNSSGDI